MERLYEIDAAHAVVYYVTSGAVRCNLVIVKSPKTNTMKGQFFHKPMLNIISNNILVLKHYSDVKQVMKHETYDLLKRDMGNVCIEIKHFKLLLTMQQLINIQKLWWEVDSQIESFKRKIETKVVGDEFQEYLAMIMCAASYLHGDVVEAMARFLKQN